MPLVKHVSSLTTPPSATTTLLNAEAIKTSGKNGDAVDPAVNDSDKPNITLKDLHFHLRLERTPGVVFCTQQYTLQ